MERTRKIFLFLEKTQNLDTNAQESKFHYKFSSGDLKIDLKLALLQFPFSPF